MIKQVYRYKDIRNQIDEAVDILCNPVRGTISPKGRNVLFEDDRGTMHSTNDGATIVKNITLSDPIKNAIVSIIKQSSLKTNTEVGDGTSTSILLSWILIKEGLKLVDSGLNAMDVKKELFKFGEQLTSELKKKAIKVKGDKDILRIATISANNDTEIAKDTLSAIKIAGLDGMVFIEPNNKVETEIIEDVGFHINAPLFDQDLRSMPNRFVACYYDVPTLITDKRLYYREEAETILKSVLAAGYKSVVVIARDFIGEAVNTFIANHKAGNINVLLIKDPKADGKNNETLEDLAIYLGGKVVSEKTGKIVDTLKISDFCISGKAYADQQKTLITPKVASSKALKSRIQAIRKELEKDNKDDGLQIRLAALTNGMVTIRVGGSTQIEVSEKIFRFEDAINAARAAMRDGYLVGGGLSIFRAFDSKKYPIEYVPMYKKFVEANIRQIAENCGKHADTVLAQIKDSKVPNTGYNALTDKIENLLEAGVIDPYKVTEMAINNSISVASEIISSDYLVINEIKEDKETNNK